MRLYFWEGAPFFAQSNSMREVLGRLLLGQRVIDQDAYERATLDSITQDKRLGRALVDCGAISESRLDQVLHQQIRMRFVYSFSLHQATLEFWEEIPTRLQDQSARMELLPLIRDGISRHVPLDLLSQTMMGQSHRRIVATCMAASTLPALSLTPDEARVMESATVGETVGELAGRLGMSPAQLLPTLYLGKAIAILKWEGEPDPTFDVPMGRKKPAPPRVQPTAAPPVAARRERPETPMTGTQPLAADPPGGRYSPFPAGSSSEGSVPTRPVPGSDPMARPGHTASTAMPRTATSRENESGTAMGSAGWGRVRLDEAIEMDLEFVDAEPAAGRTRSRSVPASADGNGRLVEAVIEASRLHDQGQRSLLSGDFDDAVHSFRQAVEIHFGEAEYRASLGLALYLRERIRTEPRTPQLEEALESANSALAMRSPPAKASLVQALSLRALGREDEAEVAHRRAVEQDPELEGLEAQLLARFEIPGAASGGRSLMAKASRLLRR